MCPQNPILLTDPTVLIFARATGEVKCVVLKQQPVVAVHRAPKLGVRKNKLAVFSFHNFARLQDSTIHTALNPDMRAYNRTSATSKQPHYPLVPIIPMAVYKFLNNMRTRTEVNKQASTQFPQPHASSKSMAYSSGPSSANSAWSFAGSAFSKAVASR